MRNVNPCSGRAWLFWVCGREEKRTFPSSVVWCQYSVILPSHHTSSVMSNCFGVKVMNLGDGKSPQNTQGLVSVELSLFGGIRSV